MLIDKNENGWELHRISNGKLSCENYSLESSDDIEKVRSCIQQKFGDILKEEGIIVSWDNWSGTYIMQMPGMDTDSSELVIKEIYEFLSGEEID